MTKKERGEIITRRMPDLAVGKHIEEINASEPSATQASGWRAVAIDCMPEIDQRFDAWVNGRREPDCGAYVGRGWSKEDQYENMRIKGITHWMPLPSPPHK